MKPITAEGFSMTTAQPDAGTERFRALIARHASSKAVSGFLSLVSKSGTRHTVAASATGEEGQAIAPDSLVRIASLTKPIAAAATMALVERGLLNIDDPIERFIPELGARRVLRQVDAPLDETDPARRSITVRHLLTCTMGFGFPMTKGPHLVMKEAATLQLGLGPPKPATPHAPDEWIRRLASLPLMAHPGDVWMYDTSFAVLGVLISRAAGTTLSAVLREHILDPLGMADTDFHVPENKLTRLVPCHQAGANGAISTLFDDPTDSQWAKPPAFPDAAGGLVSTADDYLRFAQMRLAMGVAGGRRILAEMSVKVMTSNHISESQRGPASAMFLEARGWGFGVSVALPPDDDWSRVGRYGWEGGLGTSWFNDPNACVAAILVSQRFPPAFELFTDFWRGVSETWGASVDRGRSPTP
jgi:CubicO group peptidase (beta-lactamase class C family)